MKSARMLIALASIPGLATIGCLEPGMGLGLVRPIRSTATAPSAEADGTEAATTARNAEAATSGEAGNDRAVSDLTQLIDALAQRPAVAGTQTPAAQQASATQPADASAHATTRPAPALAQYKPADNAPHEPAPAVAPAESSSSLANAPVGQHPPVSAAPGAASEVVASPTPRPAPAIQAPSSAPAAPGASPNVGVEIIDVRPAIGSSAGPVPAPASANQPSLQSKSNPVADLGTVIAEMERAAQLQPPNPEDELRLRLLYLAAGLDEKSTTPVKGMDPIQAELLNAVLKTVASSRQAIQQPINGSTAALTSVDELRRLLGQQSGISIPRVALVTKVTSFGDYEAINPLRFKQGNDIHAYVYTEIANFRSEPVEGDRLRTRIAQRVQVFDAAGKMIWERNEPNIEDSVRTPRRDFFIPFPLHLPGNLPPGDYALKVTVEDRIGATTDQQRLSFSIQ